MMRFLWRRLKERAGEDNNLTANLDHLNVKKSSCRYQITLYDAEIA